MTFWEKDKRYRYTLWLCILVMFVIGTVCTLKYGNYFLLGDLDKLNNDDVRYLHTAKVLAEQGKLVYHNMDPTLFIMPGYPIFIALIVKIFGSGSLGIIAIRMSQLVLQCVCLYILYFLAKELVNKKTAIIACILTVLYLPEYVAANLILTEVLYKTLYMLLFYFSIIAIRKNKTKYYVFSGISWALVCLVRPNAAAFPLFIIIFWIVNKYSIKDMIKYTSIVFVIFVTLFSPWWIRNYKLTNKFVLFTESSANPKLLGTFIRWGAPSFYKDIPKEYKYDEFLNDEYLTEDEQNNLANYMIKRSFQEEPLKYTYWYTLGKTEELYKEAYYWKPIFRVNDTRMNFTHISYITLGILGLIAMIRRKIKGGKMLIVFLLINTAVYLPFITFSRYGYPNIFVFIIGAAYTLNVLFCKDEIQSEKSLI